MLYVPRFSTWLVLCYVWLCLAPIDFTQVIKSHSLTQSFYCSKGHWSKGECYEYADRRHGCVYQGTLKSKTHDVFICPKWQKDSNTLPCGCLESWSPLVQIIGLRISNMKLPTNCDILLIAPLGPNVKFVSNIIIPIQSDAVENAIGRMLPILVRSGARI